MNLKMNVTDVLKKLELPNRDNERSQITLRLSFNEYARLHALKETYGNNHSVNDLINLLLKESLDEVINALESDWKDSFNTSYKAILEKKSDDDSKLKEGNAE